MQTMQAQFNQTIYDNHNKPGKTAHGKMALARPGKFRWEVTAPMPQLIIANGQKLWIYDPDLQQVTIRHLASEAGEAPALLLTNVDDALNKDFVVEEIKKNGDTTQWFSLKPKRADSLFARTEMGFLNGKITQMILQDHLGHTTKIQFQSVQTNINLPEKLFTFKAPANVDVIDETRK
jgi:outer membrane lipoprotein carrier protein